MKLIVEIATFIPVDVPSTEEARRVAAQEFKDNDYLYRSYVVNVHPGLIDPTGGLVPLERVLAIGK